jgi:hypothetical protein
MALRSGLSGGGGAVLAGVPISSVMIKTATIEHAKILLCVDISSPMCIQK